MKLYDFPFSPNCRKVRAVAYELGIPAGPLSPAGAIHRVHHVMQPAVVALFARS